MSTVMDRRPRAGTASDRPPNRQAEQISGRSYVSHSQLSCMRGCPRKFAFQYVEQVPADFVPSSLIFGGSIHAALELHYRALLEGLQTTPEALLSAYHDAWVRQSEHGGDSVPIRFNKGEDVDTLQGLAQRIIAAFLASALASPKGTIVGVEEELRVVLDPQLPDLLARVDLVTMTDGSLHVVDFKTCRSKWTDQKAEESAEQLLLYEQTVRGMSRHLGVPVRLHYAIITKTKAPAVQLIPVPTNPGRVSVIKESVRQVWEAIRTGNFYPNPSPQNCTTCPYRSRCPVFGGKR